MPRLLILLVLLIFAGAGFFLYQTSRSKSAIQETTYEKLTTSPSASPVASPQVSPVSADPCEVLAKGSSDVPPLYSGIEWQQPTIAEYEVPLGEEGSKKMSGCLIKSQGITDLQGRDVRVFYSGKIIEAKWYPLTSADGMYSSIESYRKNSKYFVIQQTLAPSVSLPTQKPLVVIELFYSQ